MPLLSVENLTVEYRQHNKYVAAVRDVSFSLGAGETLGLVGESGCGKSTLALAIMGLLPKAESRISSGKIVFDGQDLTAASEDQWRKIRGKNIAMIFQDPFSSLNPVLTIENQLQECLVLETGRPDRKAAQDILNQVQLPDPARILSSYPHQLSGGQRQRVMIAMALSRHPKILIADEPTTALDVTVQDEIIKLLVQLQKSLRMSLLFVTHNMGLVKATTQELAVMYAGQIVEIGKTHEVLKDPKHPYTQGLLDCLLTLTPHGAAIPVLKGQPPAPGALPDGCPFHPRCPSTFDKCRIEDPVTRKAKHSDVRCHLY